MTALALAYGVYVIVKLPELLLPVLALMVGLAAALVYESSRARREAGVGRRAAWSASFAVIVAVLHARALPADSAHLVIQIGLAAFVATSATLTLFMPARSVGRAALLAAVGALGLAVGASIGPAATGSALTGAALAGTRPLSALEVIRVGHTRDPWLMWAPITSRSGRR